MMRMTKSIRISLFFLLIHSIHMVTEESTFTANQFAVLAFLLQRYQQGTTLPRHLPMPLRSLLPPRGPRSLWTMTPGKEHELGELWQTVMEKQGKEKQEKMMLSVLKTEMTNLTKNASTTRKMYD